MAFEWSERYVKIGHESTWGTLASTRTAVQYPLTCELNARRVRIEEDIVSPSRQAYSRAFVQIELTGALEWNPLSSRMFYYALGSYTSGTPIVYTGSGILPSFSLEQGLRIPNKETLILGYVGLKVDRLELTIEGEEDIVMSADLVGKDVASITGNWDTLKPTGSWIDYTPTYCKSELKWGSEVIPLLRTRLEISNNLSAKFAGVGMDGVCTAVALKEGGQEITGEFRVDSDLSDWITSQLGTTEGTLTISWGSSVIGTITITANRVALDETPIRLRGKEELTVDIPFRARTSGPSAYDAVSVSHNHPSITDPSELPW